MAFDNAEVSVATTATRIATGDSDGCIATIKNIGSADVYLGGSSVTTATGLALGASAAMSLDLDAGENLYGIVATGTVLVRVMRHRL